MNNRGIQLCRACGTETKQLLLISKNDIKCGGTVSLYRCGACGMVYLADGGDYYDDELYAYYQKYNDKSKEDIYNPLIQESCERVLKFLESYGVGKNILDVGCGKGEFVHSALAKGYNVQGIELAQHAVDIAHGFDLPVRKLDFFPT